MDEQTWSVMRSVQQFLDEAVELARQNSGAAAGGVRLVEAISEHLGTDATQLAVVRFDTPSHQFVNLDVALAALVDSHGGGEVIGVGGGDQRHHQTLGDMLSTRGPWGLVVGAVDRTRLQTGPDSSREAIALGLHLFRYDGVPVAVLQRQANRQFGNLTGLEIVAAQDITGPLLADVARLMHERSVFRGQVIGFDLTESMYGPSEGGISFLTRPEVAAGEVILPEGTLARVERHVAGTVRHRDVLRAAGQHLKRGLLLYGPPGTGKTHTVRYLLGQIPQVTCVVLAGRALGLVSDATELAKALQPSLVVLEDVDLIAEHREMHMGPQPLLFTLLDAMDGLATEADVAFVLTTNRADLLEAALSQRPGRVDLAVEVPLPDESGRRRLLDLYTTRLPLSTTALDEAARRSGGVTASFFKELARRTALLAAESAVEVDDGVLDLALTEMLDDSQRLTRALLGAGPGSGPAPGWGPTPGWGPAPGLAPVPIPAPGAGWSGHGQHQDGDVVPGGGELGHGVHDPVGDGVGDE
jgi:ATPase family associated with various cellular activities (AAA)